MPTSPPAGPFDPVRYFYDEIDAFPPLGAGNVARLTLDTERTLLYSLGDGQSNYPFSHVAVIIYGHDDYSVRFFRSRLPRGQLVDDDGATTLKERHFHHGTRVRDRDREREFMRYFAQLKLAHDDVLRAYQLNALPHRSDAYLPHLLWLDVMRVVLARMSTLMRSPAPEDVLKVAQRVEAMYPYAYGRRCGACRAARRWWWRWRLLPRLRYHYPSLPRKHLRLLRDDIAYLVRFPYRATA